ncbi:MAG: P-loop ATPase, partial [Paracoccaceae bacterium]|nr:P-loop ATPase [Paracoccaceae bacterium]
MSAAVIDLNDVRPLHSQQDRYDLDLIVQRLRDAADDWVPRLFPRGRRLGDEWRLANIRGDAPRKMGSCVITLRGPRAGDWIDFDGNHGGGPISAIEEATGLDGRALIAEAAEIAGVAPGAAERLVSPTPPAARRDPTHEIARLIAGALPLAGSLGDAYLRARSLSDPGCPDLLCHPDLPDFDTRRGWPGLIALPRVVTGERAAGIHRTFLLDDGSAKGPAGKKMLGSVADAAVRLFAMPADGHLGIAEG